MVQTFRTLVPKTSYPPDEPFSVHAAYLNDTCPDKVNLGIGVYLTDEGAPWPLPVVAQVEKLLHSTNDITRHEYLPIQGDLRFLDLARDLAFDLNKGAKARKIQQERIVSVQTVSGTGANHVGAKYLADVLKPRQVWLPDPTWGTHNTIWRQVGVVTRCYPYYDATTNSIDFEGMIQMLEEHAQHGDVVLFHACAHNPTGCDPSHRQWLQLVELCSSRGLVPFLDLAYQGFATGDVSEDAFAVKAFLNCSTLEFCVAQSFSKNFGLYGQRVGVLHVVVGSESIARRDSVLSNLCYLVRNEYSMAPRTGSDIVGCVLGDPALRVQWEDDLRHMSGRLRSMRQALYDELVCLGTPGSWNHILEQVSHPRCCFGLYVGCDTDLLVRSVCSHIPG